MVKSYLHAFISMKYLYILPTLAFGIFILAFIFFRTGINALRIAAIALAGVLAVLMILFYGERMSITRHLSKFNNWKEYNDSYIIGQAFLLEDRMLVYDRKIMEFAYASLTRVEGSSEKKDRFCLTFISDNAQAKNITSSKGQAQRLCAFLQSKNALIEFTGIEPEGDGVLAHVESGK